MIELEEAFAIVDAHCAPLAAERVPLVEALGATLAADVLADRDQPPFDRATMDGYAVRMDETATTLRVVRSIAAGQSGPAPEPGEAVRIFTGAPVPGDHLRVVMQEETHRDGECVVLESAGGARNVAPRGEDVRAGAVVIPAGTVLDAAALAVLASVGVDRPAIVRRPRTLHFTSGNEVVPISAIPGDAQIRNSNAALVAALTPIARQEHLPDDRDVARRLVHAAEAGTFDVLLFSGGASVGEHDHTRALLEELGFGVHFSQVNIRPGKPLIFATRPGAIAFGIPGNPLSHLVCFHAVIARALARLRGAAPPAFTEARLGSAPPARPNARVTLWPARLRPEGGSRVADLVPWNTSGHLGAAVGVNALVRVPANAALPPSGATVQTLAFA